MRAIQAVWARLHHAAAWAKALVSRLLPADKFGRQAAIMGAGAAAVQAVGVFVAPILTRLYTPADFGVMAAFGAVTEVLVLATTLQYDRAIPITTSEREAAKLLSLALTCTVLVSALALAVVITLPAAAFAHLSADPRLFSYRWFIALALLGGGCYASLVAWATRRQQFTLISTSRAYQSLSSVTVQLGAGAFGAGVLGLILGAISNMTSGLGMLLRQVLRDLAGHEKSPEGQRLAEVAWSNRKYPAFTLPTALLNQLSRSAPTIMISSLFGASATGFYSLGLRVIGLPSMMISGALSSVFLSRIPEALQATTLPDLMEDMTRRLAPASAYLYGTMAFFGPQLFTLVFGPRWGEAGYYVRFLSPWLAIMFVFSPQTTVVLARGRQGAEAVWQIGVLLVRLFGLYAPIHFGMGQREAVACFGAASLATSTAYYLWMLRVGDASLRRVAARLMADGLPVVGILGAGKLACAALNGSDLIMLLTLATTGIVMRKRILGAWKDKNDNVA